MTTINKMASLPNSEGSTLARASAQELSALLANRPDTDRVQVKLDGHNLIT